MKHLRRATDRDAALQHEGAERTRRLLLRDGRLRMRHVNSTFGDGTWGVLGKSVPTRRAHHAPSPVSRTLAQARTATRSFGSGAAAASLEPFGGRQSASPDSGSG